MKRPALTPIFSVLILPFLAIAAPAQQVTGIAHPEQLADPSVSSDHYVKPSQANASAPAYQESYPATVSEPRLLNRGSDTPAPIVEAAPAPPSASSQYVPYKSGAAVETAAVTPTYSAADPSDGQIVTEVPGRPHELNRGTLLRARLRETLNTRSTAEGAVFTAELLADVGHHGEVMLPAGSLIRGHVASVHGGKRIGGTASMRLRPETVSLPDGTLYHLDAQVTDLDGTEEVRVNDEGTVVLRTHPKAMAAVLGGVTATAAVTGAVIGGGVGAAVGAIAGAGVATAWWLKRDVQETLPAGTNLFFALEQPLTISPR